MACDPPAALKKVARIVEKVVALGSPAKIFDVLRCLVVVDDMALAAAALGRVVGDAALDVVRVKERFVAKPAAGGWRDALVNARFTGDDVANPNEGAGWEKKKSKKNCRKYKSEDKKKAKKACDCYACDKKNFVKSAPRACFFLIVRRLVSRMGASRSQEEEEERRH